jgi:hypothetical protein
VRVCACEFVCVRVCVRIPACKTTRLTKRHHSRRVLSRCKHTQRPVSHEPLPILQLLSTRSARGAGIINESESRDMTRATNTTAACRCCCCLYLLVAGLPCVCVRRDSASNLKLLLLALGKIRSADKRRFQLPVAVYVPRVCGA